MSALHDGDAYGGRFLPPDRELWRPSRDEQMAALEILLASSIPTELRTLLREREFELATRKEPS